MKHADLSTMEEIIEVAKTVARRYREITGKPLGITGEVGELVAARLLNLELSDARQCGFDAIGPNNRRIQIKSRCILPNAKPGQRVGSIRLDHEWDDVMLVLMDQDFEPVVIYEATREAVELELKRPGSKARNERGALPVGKFKSIGQLRWSRDKGVVPMTLAAPSTCSVAPGAPDLLTPDAGHGLPDTRTR